MTERAPLDIFRRVLAGAARAIARDAEIEVAFASDAGPASGKVARVASPGPGWSGGWWPKRAARRCAGAAAAAP